MKLIYSKEQIKCAAKYLFKRNKHLTYDSTEQLAAKIERDLLRYANDVKRLVKKDTDWRFLATAGYYILITSEDGFLEAKVLVDPAVSKDVESAMVQI